MTCARCVQPPIVRCMNNGVGIVMLYWAPSVRHVWCTLNNVYSSTGQTGGVVNDLPKNITHSLSFTGVDPDVI